MKPVLANEIVVAGLGCRCCLPVLLVLVLLVLVVLMKMMRTVVVDARVGAVHPWDKHVVWC